MASIDKAIIWITMNIWAAVTLMVQGEARIAAFSTAVIFLLIFILVAVRDQLRKIKEVRESENQKEV